MRMYSERFEPIPRRERQPRRGPSAQALKESYGENYDRIEKAYDTPINPDNWTTLKIEP